MAENIPDSSDYYAEANLEQLSERIKKYLFRWRQLMVMLHKYFIWEQQYYPIVINAIIGTVYCIIWICDSSLLTTMSMIAIAVFLCDYFVPMIYNNCFDTNNWNTTQDRIYSDICTELALGWITLVSAWNSWQKIKDSKPKVYFIGFLATLLVFGWIGTLINNLFLAYLMTTFIALFPGLKYHGLLQKYVGECIRMIKKSVAVKKKIN